MEIIMNADKEAVSRLQEVIGYRFKDPDLLTEALSHTSYTNERKLNKTKSYQRLEFLGDAVLELFSSKYLYDLYPDHKEGELTKERASMVCEQSLAVCARHIDLGDYILLGVGESMSGGNDKPSILSDVFEALIGAIFIDGGYEEAQRFIEVNVFNLGIRAGLDMKTMLQEMVQASGGNDEEIVYELVQTEGPEHMRTFTVSAMIGGTEYGRGSGKSKKEAEMQAASQAIVRLKKHKGE